MSLQARLTRQPPAPSPWCGGNTVRLLRGGHELFPALEQAIAQAREEVWLASYIFYSDGAAQAIARALAGAAQRGVRVKVVVDGFGSLGSLAQVEAWLRPAGVALVVFRPLTRWWNWLQPGQLRRLHQKLCVVDGRLAFVGGINLIDDLNDISHGLEPGGRPRLDFAVQLEGPVVAAVEQALRAVWSRASLGQDWRGELMQRVRSAEPLRALRLLARQLRLRAPASEAAADSGPVRVAFVVRDNLYQRRAIEQNLMAAIRQARNRVDLVTPYFYPGHGFRRALVRAARRGVRVRLLLQGKLDYRLAGLAARVLYDEMLAAGVEIYEYLPAYLHAKMALVDADWVTVGSSNIDPLSLLLNLEANVVVADLAFSATASAEFEAALAESERVRVPPLSSGLVAWGGRALVAWLAHIYLRLAGWDERY